MAGRAGRTRRQAPAGRRVSEFRASEAIIRLFRGQRLLAGGLADLAGRGGGGIGGGTVALARAELLLEPRDDVAELVGHGAGLDRIEQRAVSAADVLEELTLEAADVSDRDVV